VSDWLERLRGLVRSPERAPDTPQSWRVEAALAERPLFFSDAAWLAGVLAALGDEPVDPRSLEHLLVVLRAPGYSEELSDEEAAAHLGFWRSLAGRHPGDPVLAAQLADTELVLGDPVAAVRGLLDAFDRRPELFFELGWDLEEAARAAGPELLFRWQLHQLHWLLRSSDPRGLGDEARELYGELLDAYRDDPERLAALRQLGAEIHRL
jgi:hypothetical protein